MKKNKMKRVIASLLLVALMVTSMVACSAGAPSSASASNSPENANTPNSSAPANTQTPAANTSPIIVTWYPAAFCDIELQPYIELKSGEENAVGAVYTVRAGAD